MKEITGERVRELREDIGMIQEEFAAMLGVSLDTINRIENGKRPCSQYPFVHRHVKMLDELAEDPDCLPALRRRAAVLPNDFRFQLYLILDAHYRKLVAPAEMPPFANQLYQL